MGKSMKGKKKEIIDLIESGMKSGIICFDNKISLNFKELSEKKGESWTNELKNQLTIFKKTLENM